MWKTSLKDLLIDDEHFLEKMKEEILPFLQEHLQEGYMKSEDGLSIHYAYLIHPQEEAAVVISHGFCEFIGKYHEVMYYLYEMGYSVFFIHHRGHGFSEGRLQDPDCVYVRKYDSYVNDLKQYIDEVVLPRSTSKNLYLFAHSMGGCVGTLFLEQYPSVFKKAVLSSPMMEMNYGKFSVHTVGLICAVATVFGRLKSYTPGQHGFDNRPVFETSSALSKQRYDYVFQMRQGEAAYCTYGASLAWIKAGIKACRILRKNIDSVAIPVLLCQAGKDSMVLPWAHDYASEHCDRIRLVRFDESKHEIFNATSDIREEYYMLVFDYFKE